MIIRTGALTFLLLFTSCATTVDPPPAIRMVAPTVLAPEQLTALRETIRATGFQPDWVDVERRPAQISEAGHDTVLLAEAVKAPRIVAPTLCVGERLHLAMKGSGFANNLWRMSGIEQYAVYQRGVVNPCELGRHRNARIRIRGQVQHGELLAVLQVIEHESATSHSASVDPVRLLEDERIVAVAKKPSPEGLVIEVITSRGEGRGRRFQFRVLDGAWVGQVVGGWIA